MFAPLFVISPSPAGRRYSIEQHVDNQINCPSALAAIDQHQ
jgi:hypothetical protein